LTLSLTRRTTDLITLARSLVALLVLAAFAGAARLIEVEAATTVHNPKLTVALKGKNGHPASMELVDPRTGRRTGLGFSGIEPAWSPDGRLLAYADSPNTNKVWMWSAASRMRRFVIYAYFVPSPTWSPDGKQLAYGCYGRICAMRLSDGKTREIASVKSIVHITYIDHLAWSPQGNRIAFDGLYDHTFAVLDVDVRTGRVRQLTRSKEYALESPSYSPDGTQIAYATCPARPRNPSMRVMTADGQHDRMLIPLQGCAGEVAWSPDGALIAVEEDDDSVWVVHADGTGKRPLVQGSLTRGLAWRP